MKRWQKIASGIGIFMLVLTAYNLAEAGRVYNWGPFSFLHSWNDDVKAIELKYSKDRQAEIIFYGASNFALWTDLDEDFPGYKVQNHAFGGSTDADLLEYADRLLYPYNPKIVVFQTGSNDYVSMKGTDEEKLRQVMDNKKEMFELFHKMLPDSKFVIMSGLLLPGREEYAPLTQKVNAALETYANKQDFLYFVDADTLTYDGSSFDESLFKEDRIHLNHKGQLMWRDNHIQGMLDKIISENSWHDLTK